jgi:signal transduction histidine kinase
MTELIEDLLAYSRLERSIIRNSKINISTIINSILFFLKNDIEKNKITVDVHTENMEIISDSDGLTIAIRNLIENAIKFSSQINNPEIKILVKDNVYSWTISVEDNGIGFDMKFHDRIFEIFQRLNLPEHYSGTGIGLAMVKKTMERLNGKVWAESSPGKGAKFYLEIPK